MWPWRLSEQDDGSEESGLSPSNKLEYVPANLSPVYPTSQVPQQRNPQSLYPKNPLQKSYPPSRPLESSEQIVEERVVHEKPISRPRSSRSRSQSRSKRFNDIPGGLNQFNNNNNNNNKQFTRIEPLWAQQKSIEELEEVCKSLKVPYAEYRYKTREGLIETCDYFARFPTLENDVSTLQQKCASEAKRSPEDPDIQGYTKEELVSCIVDKRVLKMRQQLDLITPQETQQDLSKLGASKTAVQDTIAVAVENTSELDKLIAQQNFSPLQRRVITGWLQEIQKRFTSILTFQLFGRAEEESKAFQTLQDETKDLTGKQAPTGPAENRATSISALMKWVTDRSFDLVGYVSGSPKMFSILLVAITQFRKAWCLETAQELAHIKIMNGPGEEPQTWPELFYMYLENSNPHDATHSKNLLWDSLTETLSTASFTRLWRNFTDLTSTVFNVSLLFLESIPHYGAFLAGPARIVSDTCAYALREAFRQGTESYLRRRLTNDPSTRPLLSVIPVESCVRNNIINCEEGDATCENVERLVSKPRKTRSRRGKR